MNVKKVIFKYPQMLILGGFVSLLFMSCSSELGITKNPDIVVGYIEQPSQENYDKLLKQYRQAIKNYKGTVSGLHADYAVLLMKAGKKEDALKQFDLELKLYPESQKYVDFLKSTLNP